MKKQKRKFVRIVLVVWEENNIKNVRK